MKKFFALLIAVIMAISVIPALAEETATVTVNGEDVTFTQNVIVKGDTPYVPLRPIANVMELETAWDNDLRCAKAKGSILDITVPIGEKYVKNANMKKSISAENIIYNDYTYMPVDALAAFDITYKWDAENNALALSVPVLNGKYYVIRHKATGLVMMPEGAATTDGPLIRLVEADGSDAQLWQFMTRGENLYRPINQKSLRSMDMPNWRTDEGLELIQYGNTEGTNQWVHPVKNEDGTYQLIIHHSMMYLGATENNTIAQYNEFDPERDSYELVEVVKKVEAEEEGEKVEIEKADPLDGKFVTIVNTNTMGERKAVTVEGLSKEENAKLSVSDTTDTDSDVWRITKVEDGYTFTNKDSSLVMSSMGAGGNVRQKASTGSDEQIYVLEAFGDSYYIKNKASGFYLTESFGTLIETVARENFSQLFYFDEPFCNIDTYAKDNFGGKYYEIKHSSGKVMGVPEDVIKTNALVKALDDTDVDTNVWALVSMGGGKYVISNKVSIQSFDVPNGRKDEGLEIIQYESNFGANQIYVLEDAGDNKFRIKCQVSDLYLTLTENDTFAQYALKDDDSQLFTFEEKGVSTKKMVGAVAQMFLIRGEDDVTSAKVQWNVVHGATHYDIYRSVDGGDFEFLTASKGQIIDDYDLEIGKEYKYAVYAIENDTMIDYAITDAVAPYTLPADLSQSSNLEASDVKRPNTMIANDGTYYHFQQWGIDGVPGFGRVMMQTSKDDVTYTEWKEVLNYKEILAHETCQNFTQCRFESVNFVYNKKADTFAFIAHFEADGGYGTAMISIASMKSTDERMTFRGAYRPEGDDCRDLNVFVDEDSSGYIIAAANNNANLGIYKLNEDWSAIEGRLCFVSMYKWRELPSVLKKDGTYYLFSSGTAGWYPTQGMVATATDMGGPWSELKHVGNTTTFSSQSGTMFTLHEGGNNHIMATYRWMFGWQDATNKSTTNRRYPVSVSNGYAFYDFFDELLYNWENDVLIPVQTGRILSQDKAVKTVDTEGYATGNSANDGHYRTSWYQAENNWPFTWEADLGKVSHLTQLQVSWLIWNGSEAYYNYILEASVDGENWTKVLDKSEGYTDYGFTCDNIDGYGRYVRLTVLNAKPRNSENNTYPAQLQEVKILGK
ncbi:MAG: RICIN domain-containing protein [Clostridia bacterium]|nr:RICIN domain-containing protein [Clostridia bacterium]